MREMLGDKCNAVDDRDGDGLDVVDRWILILPSRKHVRNAKVRL